MMSTTKLSFAKKQRSCALIDSFIALFFPRSKRTCAVSEKRFAANCNCVFLVARLCPFAGASLDKEPLYLHETRVSRWRSMVNGREFYLTATVWCKASAFRKACPCDLHFMLAQTLLTVPCVCCIVYVLEYTLSIRTN